MTMIMMTENLATKITINNLQIPPSVGTMKLGKIVKNMSSVLAKIVKKKSIFSKINLPNY